MLSNGPGDPKECVEIIEEIKKLYASNVPIFAICLGHQLMSLATGADTHRLSMVTEVLTTLLRIFYWKGYIYQHRIMVML